jgi:hypothetical protein
MATPYRIGLGKVEPIKAADAANLHCVACGELVHEGGES